MKKAVLIFTFLVISLISYGQKRVNVPGTKVWMVPPEGATKSKDFTGFQVGEYAAIQIMDLVGGNFYTNTRNYKKENFEAKGIKVLDFQKLTIAGYPAIYAHLKGAEPLSSHQLVFGDSTFSTSLMANYASFDKELGQKVKKSIFSVVYKKDHKVDPFAHASFRLDDRNTKLKFKNYSANMYYYTIGDDDQAKQNKQFLIAYPLPKDGISSMKDIAKQAILEMGKYGFTATEVIEDKAKKINGYQAQEIIVKGRVKDKLTYVFVTIIENGNNQVLLQSMHVGEKFDKQVFTELTNTIRFKK
ncbi:hypothetical protein BKI52_04725 [marine bacterium AO1-C]|nr:hypothetical protein BKI52_04725 [marine bacterium AO1-C]